MLGEFAAQEAGEAILKSLKDSQLRHKQLAGESRNLGRNRWQSVGGVCCSSTCRLCSLADAQQKWHISEEW